MLVGVNRCPRSQAEYYVAAKTHSEPRRRDSARRIKNSRAHQNPPGAARGPPCRSRRVNNSLFWPKNSTRAVHSGACASGQGTSAGTYISLNAGQQPHEEIKFTFAPPRRLAHPKTQIK